MSKWLAVTIVIVSFYTDGCSTQSHDNDHTSFEMKRKTLDYIQSLHTNPRNCVPGAESFPLQFQHAVWTKYAEVTAHMSNLVTKIIVQNRNQLTDNSASLIYAILRNQVEGAPGIFAAGVAVDEWVYPEYRSFWPYVYSKGGVTYSRDLAVEYSYLTSGTEFDIIRQQDWSNVPLTVNYASYRYNATHHGQKHVEIAPRVRVEAGRWMAPYYDCGSSNTWLVTHMSPVLGLLDDDTPVFKGVGSVDVDLAQFDIDQCDADLSTTDDSVDYFRGTHLCQLTTKCVPVAGRGFVAGAYICVCEDGFHLPDQTSFDGRLMEQTFANNSGNPDALLPFMCAPC